MGLKHVKNRVSLHFFFNYFLSQFFFANFAILFLIAVNTVLSYVKYKTDVLFCNFYDEFGLQIHSN